MKKALLGNYLSVAAVVSSIAFTGCGKQEATTASDPDPGDNTVAENTPAPPPVEPAAQPAFEPEPELASSEGEGGGGDFASKLNGYWVPDTEGMMNIVKETFTAQTGMTEFPPEMLAELEANMSGMVGRVENGKSLLYSAAGTEEKDFKILDVDQSTGEFTMKSTSTDGETETGTCKLEGDILTMTAAGQPIVLRRVDEAEFKKRMNAIEGNPAPALPPGIPAPTPSPPPAAPASGN